jgi:protein-tyrosine phosphatase
MDAEGLAESNPHGINTVITLCEKPLRHRNPSIHYEQVPIPDGTLITGAQFQIFMDAIWQNISGNVLLHCIGGRSRTPVIAACWLHSVGYKNIDAALEEIAKLRPAIDPSPILLLSIREHLK